MKPVFKSRENQRYVVDGKEVWESRSTAVGAVIIGIDKQDNVFVLAEKRSQKMPDGKGLWVVPSGYLNYDEDGWDAMRRETYEETSFFVDEHEESLVFDNEKEPFYTHTKPTENRQNIVLWYCLVYDFYNTGIPKKVESYKDSEIDIVKWIPIDKISSYEWAFNHGKRIEMALNKIDLSK